MLRIIGLALVLSTVSFFVPGCAKAQQEQPSPAQSKPAEAAGKRSENRDMSQESGNKRVAIPTIEGCSRDKTTFYSGTVTSFKRTEQSTEITIRTDWDSTEKLVQPKGNYEIEYRLGGQPVKDEDTKQIESELKAGDAKLHATVWVCLDKDKTIIKIIDWKTPKNESSSTARPSRP
jgi:hypothetical protein